MNTISVKAFIYNVINIHSSLIKKINSSSFFPSRLRTHGVGRSETNITETLKTKSWLRLEYNQIERVENNRGETKQLEFEKWKIVWFSAEETIEIWSLFLLCLDYFSSPALLCHWHYNLTAAKYRNQQYQRFRRRNFGKALANLPRKARRQQLQPMK